MEVEEMWVREKEEEEEERRGPHNIRLDLEIQ